VRALTSRTPVRHRDSYCRPLCPPSFCVTALFLLCRTQSTSTLKHQESSVARWPSALVSFPAFQASLETDSAGVNCWADSSGWCLRQRKNDCHRVLDMAKNFWLLLEPAL